MSAKSLILTVLEIIIKVVVVAVVILFAFRTATAAYDFGYRVFADQPVSVSGGRTISVSVAEGASVKEVADMLGISQSYISRLEKRIISRLKKEILRML